ncbi:MAG TPA: alpha/beta hydrolase [Acidimicrobiales bacterium]|nr:alpha/beta hydrolase [Acidimicrobiales bacterium]
MLRAYGDGTLFGEPYGQGPVRVIWLHGWGRRAQDFAAAANDVALEGIASVALDLPGFGSSPAPSTAGGARAYADMVLPALREIGDGPFVLVGHSFGGTVACVLAANHPELVRALVLTGAPLLRSPSTKSSPRVYRVLRWLHAHHIVSDEKMEAARQRYGSRDYRSAIGVMRDVLVISVNESYEDELSRLEVPVTFLWGDADREVPLDVATRASALLTTMHTLQSIHGVGHLVPTDAPGELAKVVSELTS